MLNSNIGTININLHPPRSYFLALTNLRPRLAFPSSLPTSTPRDLSLMCDKYPRAFHHSRIPPPSRYLYNRPHHAEPGAPMSTRTARTVLTIAICLLFLAPAATLAQSSQQ